MVAIPEAQGWPLTIGQPQTPRREGVARFLKKLNLKYDLHLPWNENESPNKRRKSPAHETVRALSFLHFKHPAELEGVLEEFRQRWSALRSEERRVSFLLERLTSAKTDCLKSRRRTPERSSERHRPGERISGLDLPEPVSPTLSVRHAPPSSFEMATDDFMLPPGQRVRSLKRPRSRQSLTEKFRASASRPSEAAASRVPGTSKSSNIVPRSMSTLPSPAAGDNGITSPEVSFTSNGLTSVHESFWSSAQPGTQSPASSATTVADDDLASGEGDTTFHTPPEESRCFRLDGANDLDLDGDSEMKDDRPTQATNYGSSPKSEDLRSSQLSRAHPQRKVFTRPEQSDGLRQSTLTQSEYGGITKSQLTELEEQVAQADAHGVQGQLPSPPDTDSQPESHELTKRNRVQQIPADGMSKHKIPKSFLKLPFDLRLEAMRMLQHSEMMASELDAAWREPRSYQSLHELAHDRCAEYVLGSTTDFAEHSLAAKLCWSSKPCGRVFDLTFCSPRPDDSNALERKFGRDRFLVVDVPKLHRPPKDVDLENFGPMVLDRVKDILQREVHLLGRVWRQFLVQPKKSRCTGKVNPKGTSQITFFAVTSEEGETNPLVPIPISHVLDWAVQFAENASSPQCKLYSRLDLAASRTTPTIQFDASEIVWDVEDQMPTDDPEDPEFHDPYLKLNNSKSTEAMSDGCSKMSTWAMRRIQHLLGLDYLPTVVQGRIMGAKGIWYRDDEESATDEKPAKLIWIRKSQIKVRQKQESFYEADKLTFNVVQTSRQPSSSALYADFLPILIHRKVPQSVIEGVVRECVKAIADAFLEAFPDRSALTEWISRQNNIRGARSRSADIDAVGGFATAKEEACLQMLASGFEPTRCKYLADETKRVFQQYLDWIRSKFKIRLGASTMLYGIADPFGVLKPGEIHVGFSKPFEDGRQTRHDLKKLDALVARLPSLGAPDIQRVRCVFREQLSHLTDVVIFPSVGPRSLASKLQGGDYDGDEFVVIWDHSLVQHFRNAPVPAVEDPPEHFSIEVDDVKMGEMVQECSPGVFNEQQVFNWISKNTDKRMETDKLGTITLMYGKVIYHDNSLNTLRAKQLLRIHDLMIDAAKQGYRFSDRAWDKFIEKHRLKPIIDLPDPAHRVFSRGFKGNFAQGRSANATKNNGNILDYVFFEVVEPALTAALARTEDLAADAEDEDDDLEGVFNKRLQTLRKGSPAMRELPALQAKLADLQKHWKAITGRYFADTERSIPWRAIVEEIRTAFEAIMPNDTSSDLVQDWLYRTGQDPTMWDKLRASALVGSKIKSSTFMFSAAGYELCFIKAFASGHARPMRLDTVCQMAPGRSKRKVEFGVVEEDVEDTMDVAELE